MKKSLFILTVALVLSIATVSTASAGFFDAFFGSDKGEVNLYTNRHYEADEKLLEKFEEKTGIKVNVLKGTSDELIERIEREGEDTPADLLITADAGRLYRAKEKGLLQSVKSDILFNNIPANLRDKENYWFGLTVRARIIVYAKNRVDESALSTYADLTDDRWRGRILARTSLNIYNQSLLASFIALEGEEFARDWAAGIVNNMARRPKGNDTAQAIAVASGVGDLTIMNTYYLGRMLNSSDPQEVKLAKRLGVFFPDKTHINISGIGLTKHAKNKENAIKLMEFLSSEAAQKFFASANYEYPVNPNVEPAPLLKSWGRFEAQDINLAKLGKYNQRAVEIFNEVGWQ
ncbi:MULTISPECIES: Fe(3+) ABC transporter substrate-binding protein [unclassified Candidatus Frackibacter]|uniref:Fe(3+) ABC transporter substrate-binding protein n=1 Tax=unclassified Candidatus Frackibacter TaxID=2648818 RepID=UPI000799A3A3|nr:MULTISPECIES: Fe(3+) ABC transporter substrate-binding protein [unclassified Candidatus Frackibacter]KXS45357.1 MAG: ABC-type Fe3+ transport system, periplasmic component [Candidatus Frackibacter sp. T328-2]SDC77174.1 iron(III) transport system substrate-binding protein [Candidatus Frackibacter sp. WG11]SEM90316.1 iron(III) transport system substrate-binding protein [Candidatus Frackibacter sp. WG12]SFM00387.1 iron(III) transport system substrate-binding protein [Candidatus Frackibacter sp. 